MVGVCYRYKLLQEQLKTKVTFLTINNKYILNNNSKEMEKFALFFY